MEDISKQQQIFLSETVPKKSTPRSEQNNITSDVHFQLFFPDQMPQIGSRLLISSLDLVGDYLQHCKCGTFYLF